MIDNRDILYSQKLKELRKAKKIKQAVFAELMGWKDQRACSDYERSKKHFTDLDIRKMCEILAVSYEEFVLEASAFESPKQRKNRKRKTQKPLSDRTENQDILIIANFKKILLEKELKIKHLELEIAHHRSIQKLRPPKDNDDGKVYVMV